MADETADQIRQAMDQMKAHYDTELRQALASIRDLEARLAEVEAERDEHRTERHRLMKLISVRESAWDAAEARLAAVIALCDNRDGVFTTNRQLDAIRAAARVEGDR